MSFSSLSLAFKKQYVRVFDGKGDWKKVTAATALILGTPLILPMTGEEALSPERAAGTGAQHYQALQQEISQLAQNHKKTHAEFLEAYNLSQQLLIAPENKKLATQTEQADLLYRQHEEVLRDHVTQYRNRILLVEGISEADAVELVRKAELATDYTFFPAWGDGTWHKNFRHLDECQAAIVDNRAAKEIAQQAENVMTCMAEKRSEEGDRKMAVGLAGMAGAGLSVGLLTIFGTIARNGIPRHERRLRAELAAREERKKKKADKGKDFTIKIRPGQ